MYNEEPFFSHFEVLWMCGASPIFLRDQPYWTMNSVMQPTLLSRAIFGNPIYSGSAPVASSVKPNLCFNGDLNMTASDMQALNNLLSLFRMLFFGTSETAT